MQSKISEVEKVVNFLEANPGTRFTAKEIANAIVTQYPKDYHKKRKNPRFPEGEKGNQKFISQIVAQIGARKDSISRASPHISWRDKPSPRVYWYEYIEQSETITNKTPYNEEATDDEQDQPKVSSNTQSSALSEQQLYPLLIEYLKNDLSLYCQRIDEKRSTNQRGKDGNIWLHPDIVAMQPVDSKWNNLIRTCVQKGGGQRVRLWSFEVKIELNSSNIRKSFFQAVSNSSWANEGYLVTTSLTENNENNVMQELRMLSALHGIGVILLNSENPSESEILLPAIVKSEIDWQSVNRLVVENPDFKEFVELVSVYYETGRIFSQQWNKIKSIDQK